MKNYLNLFEPVSCYIASGWSVSKNHLFNIESDYFLSQLDREDFFQLKEFFIDESIFLSKLERPLNTNNFSLFTAVVDVGCKVVDELTFELKYDVNLWLSIKRNKKSKSILSLTTSSDNPVKAGEVLSKYICLISHEEIVNITSGKLLDGYEQIIDNKFSSKVIVE